MSHRAPLFTALAMAGASAALGVSAHETKPTAAAPAVVAADTAPVGASALRVVRDKDTGKLRAPNAEESAAMQAAERSRRTARGLPATSTEAPLRVRQHANGMTSAVLGLDHLVTVQARRAPDGSLITSHTDPAHEHPVAKPAARDNRPTE